MTRTALIVGAGIGGLAAGIALRKVGWRARVFERAAAPRELGFALNLAPNAVAALRALGAADRVEAEAHRTVLGELRRTDGRLLKRIDLRGRTLSVPGLVALRQTVHGALLDATPPDDLVLASEGVGVEHDAAGAWLVLADGRRERGDVLIGADGLRSTVRRLLHPADPPPRDSGLCAIRGVVRGAGDVLGALSGVIYLGRGCEASTVRASADAIYWFVSVPATRVPAEPRDPPAIAAQALEDAVALGAALAPAGAGVSALREYERLRAARTAAMVRRGRRLAAAVAMEGAAVDWLRATVIRAIPARVIAAAIARH